MADRTTILRAEQSRAEQSRAEQSRERNANLDFLRILACIAVVGLHTLQKDLSVFNSTLYYICGFAVPAFFMASGYILLNRGRVSFKYSIRKSCAVLRVVVSWAVLVFIGSVCLDWLQGDLDSGLVLSFVKLIVKSLVQKGTLWQFWYFGALIIIYFCLPLISRARRLLPWIWIVCLVTGCLIQISSYVIGTPLQSYCIQTFRVWTWLQYFILGGLLGQLLQMNNPSFRVEGLAAWPHWNSLQKKYKEISTRKLTICLLAITVLIVVFQNIAGRYLLHNLYAEYFYDSVLTVLWLVVIFIWIMRQTLAQKCSRIIRRLAPLTMGVYIIHPLIMRVAAHFFTIDSVLLSLFYFVAILLSSVLAAWVISKIPVARKLIEL